jgi:pimeloyl-ACP methyl ester carboxylesterase
MLLAAAALGERVAALVGIAAAPDFTEWGVTTAERADLERGDTVLQDNPYGPEPTPIHAGFWRDAQAQRVLGNQIALDCPVRLLHGQRDEDVPFEISLRLAERLRSEDVQATLIKDGDHRLSRRDTRPCARMPGPGPNRASPLERGRAGLRPGCRGGGGAVTRSSAARPGGQCGARRG